MRVVLKIAVVAGLAGLVGLPAGGCSPVKGPRFWWDDQKREALPDTYMLPDWPAASPVPNNPEPFVPKELPQDEVKRATLEQQKRIEAGIPKVNAKDPFKERVKVPVAQWKGDDAADAEDKAKPADKPNADGKPTESAKDSGGAFGGKDE